MSDAAAGAGNRLRFITWPWSCVRSRRSLERYRGLLGLVPESEPVMFAPQGVRLCFLRTGPSPAAMIELIEPVDPDGGVARFLEARGEGLHHVCFSTSDLPAELDRLALHEAELIDRHPRPGAHGSVAFIHPRTLNGVLWELLAQSEQVKP